jgi:hypothetical protein
MAQFKLVTRAAKIAGYIHQGKTKKSNKGLIE